MNNKSLSPILLFTYKRLDTLRVTIEKLRQNKYAGESELFIFSDAAKTAKDEIEITGVRDFIKKIDGFKKINISEATENKGLAKSIIDGVSQVIAQYGKVIVLEDDLVTTPNFLSFMNASLDKYKSEPRVFSISGYSFNLHPPSGKYKESGYFLKRGWSWGWATWADRWQNVDWEVKDYPTFIKDADQKRKFAEGGSDLTDMLQRQMNGKMDSWAIRWFYHQFKVNGVTFYPVHSKVFNIGFGENATHTTGSNRRYIPNLDKSLSEEFVFPGTIVPTKHFQAEFLKKMGIASRIRSRAESFILSIIRKIKL
jgi:hypothetical protein